MPKQKLTKTKHQGIYSYQTNTGKKYSIRFRYKDSRNQWKEKQESGFENLTKAKMRKAELEITAKNSLAIIESENLTFEQWYHEFVNITKSSWTIHTLERFNSLYRNHFHLFNHKPLSKITLREIQNWINERLDSGLAIITVKNMYKSLMQVFNSAVKHDILVKNKLLDVVFPPEKKEIKLIEPDVVKLVDDFIFSDRFNIMDQAMYVLVKIGWRRSEVAGFSFDSILKIITDDHMIIQVNKSRTFLAQGGKSPKTLSSYRTNELIGDKAKIVLKAVNLAKEVYSKFNIPIEDNSFIFINPKDGKLFTPARLAYIFTRCNRNLNIHVTPHMFRHTFASNAIHSGISPVEVARHLGHAKVDMTLNVYSHTSKESQSQIANYTSQL